MYTELQTRFIRRFGDKILSFGCIIRSDDTWEDTFTLVKDFQEDWDCFVGKYGCLYHFKKWEFEILGHEPRLEDVFIACEENWWDFCIGDDSVTIRDRVKRAGWFKLNVCPKEHARFPYKKTIPLLQQESVIQKLLDLFPEKI